MKKKLIVVFVFVGMCTSTLSISTSMGTIDEWKHPSRSNSGDIEVLSNDLLRYIGERDPFMDNPKGPEPGYYHTSEYLIGAVGVGVFFLESNGLIDPNRENWTSTEESNVQSQINQSLTSPRPRAWALSQLTRWRASLRLARWRAKALACASTWSNPFRFAVGVEGRGRDWTHGEPPA